MGRWSFSTIQRKFNLAARGKQERAMLLLGWNGRLQYAVSYGTCPLGINLREGKTLEKQLARPSVGHVPRGGVYKWPVENASDSSVENISFALCRKLLGSSYELV